MKLPKPIESVFMYEMLLLLKGLDSGLLEKINPSIFKSLTVYERSSLIASNLQQWK